MQHIWKKIKDESANALVENVIILPLIFIIIFAIILTIFVVHDRSTIEAAARRGAIYAAHCVIDPNYSKIAGSTGDLDVHANATFSFSGISKNIKAYRYLTGGDNVQSAVTSEVQKIVNKTRISWRPASSVKVKCNQRNYFIYQNIEVSVSSDYTLPAFFGAFGLDTKYEYTATAKIAANDPDEFIRNADLVVDLITSLDEILTGGKIGASISKVTEKISVMADKLLKWTDVNK